MEYHNALVAVVKLFEHNKNYESELPIEGKITKSFLRLFLIQESWAKDSDNFCFYGGWPSKLSKGKCQAPWKIAEDDEIKMFGVTYDKSHYCGDSQSFRCNPTFFGPGKDGLGVCIKISSVTEISERCEEESRAEIDKIYDQFKGDEKFREKYLAMVKVMQSFCHAHKAYQACSVLNLQISKLLKKECGDNINVNLLDSSKPIKKLIDNVDSITNKMKEKRNQSIGGKNIIKETIKTDEKIKLNNDKLCGVYEKFLRKGVPEIPLKQALSFLSNNLSRFNNQRYLSIGDYSQNSRAKRFYILDLSTGEVSTEKVSHGSGRNAEGVTEGDLDHDGMIDRCTNSSGKSKNMTRPGFYQTGNLEFSEHLAGSGSPNFFPGKNINKLTLYGLSKTNADAEGAGVVMHEANYNEDGDEVMGRSYGCPAFVPGHGGPIVQKIKGGSLFYSYVPTCVKEMEQVLNDKRIKNWENYCKK